MNSECYYQISPANAFLTEFFFFFKLVAQVSRWGQWFVSTSVCQLLVGQLPGGSIHTNPWYRPTVSLPVFRRIYCLPPSSATQSWSICYYLFCRRGWKARVFFVLSSPPLCSVFVLFLNGLVTDCVFPTDVRYSPVYSPVTLDLEGQQLSNIRCFHSPCCTSRADEKTHMKPVSRPLSWYSARHYSIVHMVFSISILWLDRLI